MEYYCRVFCRAEDPFSGELFLDETEYQKIIILLKDRPKGLTIAEISRNINHSRITTTKFLNSLLASGTIDMRKVGPAKVFTLSSRLPAGKILSQSSDLILVLDESFHIREINDPFLDAFRIGRDGLIGVDITSTFLGPALIDRIRDPVKLGIRGKEDTMNTWIPVLKENRYFRIRITPLVFGWGEKAVAIILEDRTQDMHAEAEIRLLADLIDASPAAVTVHDFSGRFLYSNRKNLDLHGYTLDEFLKLDLSRINVPESAELIRERMRNLKETKESSFEVSHFRKDGSRFPLHVDAKLVRWGGRDVVISVATDITERKEAEEKLLESERRLSDIIDFLPDATLVINREGEVISWNHATENLTGVPASSMIGKGDYEYAIPIYGERRPILLDLILHDDPEIRKRYSSFRREGATLVAETIVPQPGNKSRVLWLKASPIYGRDGEIVGAIESIRDITAWRQAEKELRESEEKYRTLADFTYDWEYWEGADGSIVYCSPSCERITGYPPGAFLKNPDLLETIVHRPDLPAWQRHRSEAERRKEPLSVEFRVVHKDGSIHRISHCCQPVYDRRGRYLGRRVSNRDSTENQPAQNSPQIRKRESRKRKGS